MAFLSVYIFMFCQNGAGMVSLDGVGRWWVMGTARYGTAGDMELEHRDSMAWSATDNGLVTRQVHSLCKDLNSDTTGGSWQDLSIISFSGLAGRKTISDSDISCHQRRKGVWLSW